MFLPEIPRILASTQLLGGGDDAPLNVPLVAIEASLRDLFNSEHFAIRAIRFTLPSTHVEGGETFYGFGGIIYSRGEWAEPIDNWKQPLKQGRSYIAFANLDATSAVSGANLECRFRFGKIDLPGPVHPTGETGIALGYRVANNTSERFMCTGIHAFEGETAYPFVLNRAQNNPVPLSAGSILLIQL